MTEVQMYELSPETAVRSVSARIANGRSTLLPSRHTGFVFVVLLPETHKDDGPSPSSSTRPFLFDIVAQISAAQEREINAAIESPVPVEYIVLNACGDSSCSSLPSSSSSTSSSGNQLSWTEVKLPDLARLPLASQARFLTNFMRHCGARGPRGPQAVELVKVLQQLLQREQQQQQQQRASVQETSTAQRQLVELQAEALEFGGGVPLALFIGGSKNALRLLTEWLTGEEAQPTHVSKHIIASPGGSPPPPPTASFSHGGEGASCVYAQKSFAVWQPVACIALIS